MSVAILWLLLMVSEECTVAKCAGRMHDMAGITSSMDISDIFIPVDEAKKQAVAPVKKPSLFENVKKAMIGFPLFIPNEYRVSQPKPQAPVVVAPKIVQSIQDIHGGYDELETGTTVRPVRTKLKDAIAQAYQAVPTIPKGVVEALLMKESSMGTNAANRNPDIGKYAYLVGMTKIAKKELIRNGIHPDLDTPEGAIKAAAQYWDLQDDKHATSSEVYNQWYSSGKLKPEQLSQFDDMVKYYASN